MACSDYSFSVTMWHQLRLKYPKMAGQYYVGITTVLRRSNFANKLLSVLGQIPDFGKIHSILLEGSVFYSLSFRMCRVFLDQIVFDSIYQEVILSRSTS